MADHKIHTTSSNAFLTLLLRYPDEFCCILILFAFLALNLTSLTCFSKRLCVKPQVDSSEENPKENAVHQTSTTQHLNKRPTIWTPRNMILILLVLIIETLKFRFHSFCFRKIDRYLNSLQLSSFSMTSEELAKQDAMEAITLRCIRTVRLIYVLYHWEKKSREILDTAHAALGDTSFGRMLGLEQIREFDMDVQPLNEEEEQDEDEDEDEEGLEGEDGSEDEDNTDDNIEANDGEVIDQDNAEWTRLNASMEAYL